MYLCMYSSSIVLCVLEKMTGMFLLTPERMRLTHINTKSLPCDTSITCRENGPIIAACAMEKKTFNLQLFIFPDFIFPVVKITFLFLMLKKSFRLPKILS